MDIERIRYTPPEIEKNKAPEPLRAPKKRVPNAPVGTILEKRLRWSLGDQIGFHSGSTPKRRGYVLAMWSWLANVIDLLVLISLSSFFIAALSMVFGQNISTVVAQSQSNASLTSLYLEVFFLSAWLYFILMRLFMGATVGEWACDIRLGTPQDQKKRNYAFKVAGRESLMVLTGLVVLPMLSLILARDLVGNLLGLKLQTLK
ncbi:MAG: RDD family protein [Bdellovibrionia bacterium]